MLDQSNRSNELKTYYVDNQILLMFEAYDGKPVFPLSEGGGGSVAILPSGAVEALREKLE